MTYSVLVAIRRGHPFVGSAGTPPALLHDLATLATVVCCCDHWLDLLGPLAVRERSALRPRAHCDDRGCIGGRVSTTGSRHLAAGDDDLVDYVACNRQDPIVAASDGRPSPRRASNQAIQDEDTQLLRKRLQGQDVDGTTPWQRSETGTPALHASCTHRLPNPAYCFLSVPKVKWAEAT